MLDINLLINSWFFKVKVLEKKETLFDEWDFDNNIYIILNWQLKIEKYTTSEKNETKTLAILEENEIFWEASLNSDIEKEVKIIATRKSKLIYIDAKKWLSEFSKKYPEEWLNILKYIIFLSNKRLLESNYLITANYKISKEINNIKKINNKNIFFIIQKLKDIVKVDYIIFIEENPVTKDYVTIRYDTREPWKLQDIISEKKESNFETLETRINWYDIYKQKLNIWDEDLWHLVFFKKWQKFNENDKKVFLSASSLVAWLIKQKQIFEEENNKQYMKWE